MIKYIFLFLINLNVTANAQIVENYTEFLNHQWKNLKFPTTLPNDQFILQDDERIWLNSNVNPIFRNKMINRRYMELGDEINRCINRNHQKQTANWYYFASWASESAGDVINGKKFNYKTTYIPFFENAYNKHRINSAELKTDYEIDTAFRIANKAIKEFYINNWSKMKRYVEEQKTIFAETNYEIAAEMIPIGEAFLDSFCYSKKNNNSNNEKLFFSKFKKEEETLRNAFVHYHEALIENDPNIKLEKTLLASIEQVFFEQERVQRNLERSLNSPLEPSHLLGPKTLTLSAGFFFGKQGLKLHRDIRVTTLAPELVEIQDSKLKNIYHSLGLNSGNPGVTYVGSACNNWSNLTCRKRYLAPLFRELMSGESDLYEVSK